MSQFDNVRSSSRPTSISTAVASRTPSVRRRQQKSVGVILPATLTFNTGAPEIMETVAGSCRVKLAGESEWTSYGAGQSFTVPGNSSFDIEVSGEPYHYVCTSAKR